MSVVWVRDPDVGAEARLSGSRGGPLRHLMSTACGYATAGAAFAFSAGAPLTATGAMVSRIRRPRPSGSSGSARRRRSRTC